MKTATASNPKKIIKIVANVLVWLFVAFSVFVSILVFTASNSADGVPSIQNKCIINILTDSMNPTFNAGDMILGEKLTDEEKRNLQIDDIISYHVDLNGDGVDEINTHRIVEINKDQQGNVISYTTQGDNKKTNEIVDEYPVSPNDIISIYTGTSLPGVGAFISFLRTQMGFFLVILLPLIAFFIYELIKFILTVSSVKNSGKKQISAAEEEAIKQKAVEDYLRRQQAQNEEEIKKKAIEDYLRQQAEEKAAGEQDGDGSDSNT